MIKEQQSRKNKQRRKEYKNRKSSMRSLAQAPGADFLEAMGWGRERESWGTALFS